MKQYIAIGPRPLSRLYYDEWQGLWGLELREQGQGNLAAEVNRLKEDSVCLGEIRTQMQRLWLSNGLIRALYWIFNLDNYRKNYYIFQCHASLSLYEATEFNGSEHQVVLFDEWSERIQAVLETIYLEIKFEVIQPQWLWFSRQTMLLFMLAEKNKQSLLPQIVENESEHHHSSEEFQVTREIRPLLKRLECDKAFGTWVTLSEIKEAYRKVVLKVHPDKPGGDAEKFMKVQGVFKALLKKITPENDPLTAVIKRLQALADATRDGRNKERLQKLVEDYQNIKAQFEEQDAVYEKISQGAQELNQNLSEIGADYRQVSADYRQIREDYIEINVRFQKTLDKSKRLIAEVKGEKYKEVYLRESQTRGGLTFFKRSASFSEGLLETGIDRKSIPPLFSMCEVY